MHKLTIGQPVPTADLRDRVLQVDHSFYRILQVRHRHVGGHMVTDVEVEQIGCTDYVGNDGHVWRQVTVADILGAPHVHA